SSWEPEFLTELTTKAPPGGWMVIASLSVARGGDWLQQHSSEYTLQESENLILADLVLRHRYRHWHEKATET
ncbi:hypothetical protein STEG23_018012, partial [Scotinomys teguina]